jgi:hypothetical protein
MDDINVEWLDQKSSINHPFKGFWCTPKLHRFNYESKGENNERRRNWGMLLSSQHFNGRGRAWTLEWDLDEWQVGQLFTQTSTNQTSWLVCSWSTFGAQTNHGHTWIHKIHHDLDSGEAITFPLIVFFFINHKGYIQMSFCPKTPKLGVPKFSKLGLSQLWRPIPSCAKLRLKWGLKQSCSPCQEISKNMWHVT